MEVSPKHLEPGDTVVLIEQSERNQPPIGTIGIITELYFAVGGAAAYMKWDCNNPEKYRDGVLLKHLRLCDEPELDESDASLDVLFGGVAV